MSYSDPKYLAQLEEYCHKQYQKHFEVYQMQQRRRTEREEKAEFWEALEYCVHQARNIYSTRREALNEGTYKINQFVKELYLFMERNNGGASLHELRVWMGEEGRRFLE